MALSVCGQTKIAYLQRTVRIDQYIGRLDVSVDHIGRVQVLQAIQQLPHEALHVVLGQRLGRFYDAAEVCIH